jgi:3-phenylpropionate/cinnamic acid dioxygenase small subunit
MSCLLFGAIGFLAFCLTGCASVQPGATPNGDELRQINNLAACYTEGIDAFGAAKVDVGTAIWSRCFTDDVRFTLSFGAFSMTCPGEKCSLPASMTGLQRRAALARGTFERAGYVMTSHHITSLAVERVEAGTVRLKGHLQAWHFRKDGTAVVGLGTWEVDARQTPDGWRIFSEKLDSPLRAVIPKAE